MPEVKCPRCREEMRDGKCRACGAWMDSYGIVHAEGCQGGFHEECPGEPRGKPRKRS